MAWHGSMQCTTTENEHGNTHCLDELVNGGPDGLMVMFNELGHYVHLPDINIGTEPRSDKGPPRAATTQLRAKVTPPDPEANAHLPPRHWATRSRGHTGQFAPMHAMRVFTPQNHAVGAHRKTVRRRWGRARAAIATWLYIF